MANTYTSRLRFVKQEDQSSTNQWGTVFNTGVIDLVEQAIAGVTAVNVSFGDVTLSKIEGGVDQSRSMFLRIVGSPGAVRTVTVPSVQKMYIVSNNTDPAFGVRFKTSSGSAVEVAAGATTILVVEDVTNEILTFGAPDKADFDEQWSNLTLNVSGGGGFAVTAHYAKVGDFVMLQIPSFSVTFSGTTMSLEADGGLPSGIQRPTTSPAIPVGFPVSVIDDGSLVKAYLEIGSGDASFDFISADPNVTFTSDAVRSLPMNFSCAYAVTDDS